MTIDYDLLRKETSFKIVKEEDGLLVLTLAGGLLDNTLVEFTDIDMLFDENENMNLSFSLVSFIVCNLKTEGLKVKDSI